MIVYYKKWLFNYLFRAFIFQEVRQQKHDVPVRENLH